MGIGEAEEVQLLYYFVQSQRSPTRDPVVLWFTGGPGCSTLCAFFYSSGPLAFNAANYSGGLPTLHLNPFTWTQVLNMIYVDSPAGAGFSYATTSEGYTTGDKKTASQAYEFLRKWMIEHPKFMKNQVFIGGDSYSGIVVPMIVQEISNGIKAGVQPLINLKGYMLGNPKTDDYIDPNSKVPFAHRLTLISNELYESAKTSCNGDYVNVGSSNEQCQIALEAINQCMAKINVEQVLEPKCDVSARGDHRDLLESSKDFFVTLKGDTPFWCRDYDYDLVESWANDKSVQQALNVRKGTIREWKRCNKKVLSSYIYDVPSSICYHRNLTNTSLRALIYSGDHDLSIPHIGTREWIQSLNMSNDEYWQPWSVDGQVSGYYEKYKHDDFSMTFATVKGAGHVAPDYKPKECYAMIDRWVAEYPL